MPGLDQKSQGTRYKKKPRENFSKRALSTDAINSAPPATPNDRKAVKYEIATLERLPYTWNHVIEKESLAFKELEHVLFEKVEQLF